METRDAKVYDFEVRDSGSGPGRIVGPALVYGDTARLSNGLLEIFEPRSLRPPPDGPIFANVRHDQGRLLAATPAMTVEFRDDRVQVEFDLPDTDDGREAAKLARAGILRGLSIEFKALREAFKGETRSIADAYLFGVGMVPRPAYSLSKAEVRALDNELNDRRKWWIY